MNQEKREGTNNQYQKWKGNHHTCITDFIKTRCFAQLCQ